MDSSFPVGPQTGKRVFVLFHPEAGPISLSVRLTSSPCLGGTVLVSHKCFMTSSSKSSGRATVQWALFLHYQTSAMQFLQIQGLCFRAYGTPSLFPLPSTLPLSTFLWSVPSFPAPSTSSSPFPPFFLFSLLCLLHFLLFELQHKLINFKD